MKILKLAALFSLYLCVGAAFATTFFVRTDGGTRYSASLNPTGQCNGTTDAAYPGSGVNQACGFSDLRYIYNLGTGTNITNWAIAGGDTVVIRPKTGGWRIGGDGASGPYLFCDNTNYWVCSMPPPPSGTSGAHTKFLGACAYGSYTCTPITGYPPGATNETQIFGGFAASVTFWLGGAQYVDFEGLEITEHNQTAVSAHPAYNSATTYSQSDSVSSGGSVYVSLQGSNLNHAPGSSPAFWSLAAQCTSLGAPSAPAVYCNNGNPGDDFSKFGIITNGLSGSPGAGNITLQDVYIHGFTEAGIGGPIDGPWTLTRVILGFNAFAGWNFDDNSDTPDGAGSSITANYLTVIGNGFLEEYPIVHQFPAVAGWDSSSAGFGDGLSGQDTELDAFICHHCNLFYNTKDAFIGPHTQIANLDVENSTDAGNMGSEWKFAGALNANITFQNNLILENCNRMREALPGAPQNFNSTTGLPGSYLSNYCRAGGESLNFIERSGSAIHFYGNTVVGADSLMIAFGCGYYTPGNTFNLETDCGPNPNLFTGNNFIGYASPSLGGALPALWYQDPTASYVTFASTYNNEYSVRASGTPPPDTCGVNHITCSSPLLVNQPATPWPGSEAALDVFNAAVGGNSFYPTNASPLIGAGVSLSGLTADYYGTTRPSPPGLGGVELSPTAPTPTFTPIAGTYASTQNVTISDSIAGLTICYTTNGSNPATNRGSGCTAGTLYTAPVPVATSLTLKAVAGDADYLDSSVGSAAYTITFPSAVPVTLNNLTIGGTVVIQ